MTMYVLDTDSVTFQQAGRETILNRLQSVPAESVYTTVVTLWEQIRGRQAAVHRAKEGPALKYAYEQLQTTVRYFCLVNVLPFTRKAGKAPGL